MTDGEKVDHLAKLADDRWREYDHKSQAEWKLSYAVWAAMLAAGGALVTQHQAIDAGRGMLVGAAIFFSGAALIIHVSFLRFIHSRLGLFRKHISVILEERQKLLGISLPAKLDDDGSVFSGKESFDIQWTITLLLGIFLVAAAAAVRL